MGSGKSTEKRPGFQELIDDIKARRVDAVVVYKLDRLSRSVKDVYAFLELVNQHNVSLIAIAESLDTSTAAGRASVGVMAVFAQFGRETLGENSKNGLIQRARSGQWKGGITAFGYIYRPGEGLLIEADESAIVRRIFDLYTESKLSVSRIARLLNAEKVRARDGHTWSAFHISTILGNPVYVGNLRYDGKVYSGAHEPIISQEQFEQVERIMASRRTGGSAPGPRTRESTQLLGGIARCGTCGWLLTSRDKARGLKRYRCSGNQRVDERACRGVIRKAETVDEIVLSRVRAFASGVEIQAMAREEAARLMASEPARLHERKREIEAEIAKNTASFNRWADMVDEGLIDQEQFRERNTKLQERRNALHQQMAEVEDAMQKGESLMTLLDDVMAALTDFDRLWEVATLEERKHIMGLLVEKLTITHDRMALKLRFRPEEQIRFEHKAGRPRKNDLVATS